MASTTTNMGLKAWNLLSDLFSHSDLQTNWTAIDTHDHSSTKGVQIPTGGIANGAITVPKLASGTGLLRIAARTMVTSATASSGDWIQASGGVTVTLPTAALNATVAVTAVGAITGTNFVTVTGGGVAGINGVGLVGAVSFTLGTAGASVLLGCLDGVNWQVLSGQQDTGWQAITLSPGVTAFGGYTPAARLVGDRVELCGSMVHSGAIADWGTIPAGLRPAQIVVLRDAPTFVSISTGGGTIITGVPDTEVSLDGFSYRFNN